MDASLKLAATAQDIESMATVISVAALEFLPRLLAAAAVLALGYAAAGWIDRRLRSLLARSGRVEPTLLPVAGTSLRYALLILVLLAALAQLGVQTTSLLAALGAAGLAIALALQGTLQNIAAGIMVLWLRPFRIGDQIETPAVAGTVEEIDLFATKMRTADGVYKFVPNSELWNKVVTNYTRNPTRMVTIDFAIGDRNDIAGARSVLETAANNAKVAMLRAAEAVPVGVTGGAITLQLRAWVQTENYWAARWRLIEAGKRALDEANLAPSAPNPGPPPPPPR